MAVCVHLFVDCVNLGFLCFQKLPAQVPPVKWLENHKGLFNLELQVVSSVQAQVCNTLRTHFQAGKTNLCCALNASVLMLTIKIDQCHVKDHAVRPLTNLFSRISSIKNILVLCKGNGMTRRRMNYNLRKKYY